MLALVVVAKMTHGLLDGLGDSRSRLNLDLLDLGRLSLMGLSLGIIMLRKGSYRPWALDLQYV